MVENLNPTAEDKYDPVIWRENAYKKGWGELHDFLELLMHNHDMFKGHQRHYDQAISEGARQLLYPDKPYRVYTDVRNNVATLVEIVLFDRAQELASKQSTS